MNRNALFVIALLQFVAFDLRGESCQRTASCGATISGQLTFENGACLDRDTRRYDYYYFTPAAGSTVTARVTSAFFAPAIQLITPSNTIAASHENPSRTSQVSATATITTPGSWVVKVRNIDVGTGGPYTLSIICSAPPPDAGYLISISPISATVQRGGSTTFRIFSTPVGNFSSMIDVGITNLPADVTASPSAVSFPAPGVGAADIRVDVGAAAPGGTFTIVAHGRSASGLVSLGSATLVVDAPCTPPMIIRQPSSGTVGAGMTARLSVTAGGTPPFSHQWYRGFTGSTLFSIAGATAAEYETPPLASDSQYWVRISNECGSRDSATATIVVTPAPPRRRSAGHG